MAYLDQAALADDPTIRARVRVAVVTAALQILGEAKNGYSDAQFGKRQGLAHHVLVSAASGWVLESFVWATIADPAITTEATDGAIQNQVNASWGDVADMRITD